MVIKTTERTKLHKRQLEQHRDNNKVIYTHTTYRDDQATLITVNIIRKTTINWSASIATK